MRINKLQVGEIMQDTDFYEVIFCDKNHENAYSVDQVDFADLPFWFDGRAVVADKGNYDELMGHIDHINNLKEGQTTCLIFVYEDNISFYSCSKNKVEELRAAYQKSDIKTTFAGYIKNRAANDTDFFAWLFDDPTAGDYNSLSDGRAYAYDQLIKEAMNDERQRIGQLVADLRNQRGMTQLQLAQAADIAVANVSKIERGVYNVSIDILSKVLDALQGKITIEKV